MRNFLTLAISLGLMLATGTTAWVFVSLSNHVEFHKIDPGNGADVTVPQPTPQP